MADAMIIDTLIVVCCHAIWLGEDVSKASGKGTIEDGWIIEPFQAGEMPTFIDHITAGIQQLSSNKFAILVFSGGSTKPDRTQTSEAESYRLYAMRQGLLGSDDLIMRTFSEVDATDSFQNVLFSLLRFPQFVKRYHQHCTDGAVSACAAHQLPFPQKLILISHDFKRARFEELHLPALNYPINTARFEYVGIDPPFDEVKMQEIKAGDAKRGYGAWKEDLYGRGELLAGKRVARGWTIQNKKDFTRSIGNDLANIEGLGEDAMDRFKNIVAFVEDEGTPFSKEAPWSDTLPSSIEIAKA
jgi:hypothetical protein